MKCPFCKAGIPIDGDKDLVRCSQCGCDVEVKKHKRYVYEDDNEDEQDSSGFE